MNQSDLRDAHEAKTDEEILGCFDCLQELRPHIERDTFVTRIREMQRQGYRLASVTDNGSVVAVAGYRYLHTLFGGDTLYVDDLVTSAACRSHGHGATLLAWLRREAVANGCQMLHLDSGVQRARAHAFYFANGMHVNCFHFAELL